MSLIPHSKPTLGLKEIKILRGLFLSKNIAAGKEVDRFEKEVAKFIGVDYGIAVSSGTAAIIIALKALDIQTADEIILPTYVCNSVLNAIIYCGAKPIVCDVGDYWNVSAKTILPHITSRTKAIIVPYIFGIPIEIEKIIKLGIPVIEDIAQAFGTINPGNVKAGSKGTFCICSFHATKCLTTGVGGMVLFNDNKYSALLREQQLLFPMSDLQAALGISQLERYPSFIARRKEIAEFYFIALNDLEDYCIPKYLRNGNILFRFVFKSSIKFDIIERIFLRESIIIRKGVDQLIHRLLNMEPAKFPMAEDLYSQTISIPIYPDLLDSDMNKIAEVTQSIFSSIKVDKLYL